MNYIIHTGKNQNSTCFGLTTALGCSQVGLGIRLRGLLLDFAAGKLKWSEAWWFSVCESSVGLRFNFSVLLSPASVSAGRPSFPEDRALVW